VSERGTFVTSFLYDHRVVPALRKWLPQICRTWEGEDGHPHVALTENEVRGSGGLYLSGDGLPRFFSGLMHGGYSGEEALEVEMLLDELLPLLPADHGEFSICVMPEHQQSTTVFTLFERDVTVARVGPKEPL
jgi:hypothetical protein